MPHLSPLNWILIPALFWVLVAMFSSFMWWQQPSKFPTIKVKSFNKMNKWHWLW